MCEWTKFEHESVCERDSIREKEMANRDVIRNRKFGELFAKIFCIMLKKCLEYFKRIFMKILKNNFKLNYFMSACLIISKLSIIPHKIS